MATQNIWKGIRKRLQFRYKIRFCFLFALNYVAIFFQNGLYKIRMPIDLGLWIALSQVLGLTFPLVNIASAFLFGTLLICGGYITPQNLFE